MEYFVLILNPNYRLWDKYSADFKLESYTLAEVKNELNICSDVRKT